MTTRTGGCLCGAVKFSISGPVREVVFCHCSQCRRQTGHFVAASGCADADLDIDGAESLTWYAASPDAKRGFCSKCGSLMFWKRDGSDKTSIMAGSFDEPSTLTPGYHICMADKPSYYEIGDGLKQYATDDREGHADRFE
ncbi:GFA family protein [Oricola sp.]|uniref:GFA family protein n=1 Tax=Oricola sp. TaxID=1979950 RepID=UPI003BAD0D63